MDGTSREAQINTAFVTVADTLTSDYDMVDLLRTLVQSYTSILSMEAGGLMLMDGAGELQLMTSTSEAASFVEVMQLNAAERPCIDCFRTGVAVSVGDISSSRLWPTFQTAALDKGSTPSWRRP